MQYSINKTITFLSVFVYSLLFIFITPSISNAQLLQTSALQPFFISPEKATNRFYVNDGTEVIKQVNSSGYTYFNYNASNQLRYDNYFNEYLTYSQFYNGEDYYVYHIVGGNTDITNTSTRVHLNLLIKENFGSYNDFAFPSPTEVTKYLLTDDYNNEYTLTKLKIPFTLTGGQYQPLYFNAPQNSDFLKDNDIYKLLFWHEQIPEVENITSFEEAMTLLSSAYNLVSPDDYVFLLDTNHTEILLPEYNYENIDKTIDFYAFYNTVLYGDNNPLNLPVYLLISAKHYETGDTEVLDTIQIPACLSADISCSDYINEQYTLLQSGSYYLYFTMFVNNPYDNEQIILSEDSSFFHTDGINDYKQLTGYDSPRYDDISETSSSVICGRYDFYCQIVEGLKYLFVPDTSLINLKFSEINNNLQTKFPMKYINDIKSMFDIDLASSDVYYQIAVDAETLGNEGFTEDIPMLALSPVSIVDSGFIDENTLAFLRMLFGLSVYFLPLAYVYNKIVNINWL